MRFVRQSTAVTVIVGPFLDIADGYTGLTALTDQSTNGRLVKNGTGGAITASSWVHDAAGHYLVGLSTGHTDTIGQLRLSFANAATYLPVWEDYEVLSTAVYDVIFGSTAPSTLTGTAAADALLGRNVAGGSSTGRLVSEALYALRNKWTISAGTLTVYQTDDTTTSWTATTTGTTGADPVTAIDPA